jgi:ubiquinone/menaquinone biosynthesis C-methylase UbiE
MSEKTARELAFLRDLYIDNDWTARFTRILDESLILPKEGSILYVEPGTGNHLLGLREKLPAQVQLQSVHEDIEILRIADAKAQALKIDVDFERSENNRLPFPDEKFSAIIADAAFIPPEDLPSFLAEIIRVAEKGAHVNFFLPTAGSYGEFFSLLWEALYTFGLGELGAQVEDLIKGIPQVSQIEEIAKIAGLEDVKSVTKTEIFEYENGAKFMNSFLVTDFLLPRWLGFLTAEQKEKTVPEIIRTIDEDRGTMTFRLTVKATLVNGKKA